ncbi:MAG TPA: hybrid sensor histidine kinase/response regulator [Candidatus Wunengus sp. YC64]|uniref:hybrid sensor histidine kinase/response regulator n=1 Tax=Candidatus Wunengus sp. YC64 TaxID=3367700 RepID=UPI0040282AFE
MNNGFDITTFIPKFVDENRDRIQKLNRTILAFEKDASNLELLKEIMREVHTLKGTARMMGFVDIVTLSHKVEDMFVKVKEGGLQSTKGLYDVVFQALDMLASMVELKLKDAKTSVDVNEMCSRLEVILGGGTPEVSGLKEDTGMPGMTKPQDEKTEAPISPVLPQIEREEKKFKDGMAVTKAASDGKKSIRIGLDKVDVLYNHLVELVMAQMSFHQRYDDTFKLNRYAKQLKAIQTELNTSLGGQNTNNKRLHEIPAQYNRAAEYFLKEMSRYSEAYEADVVKLDAVTEGIRQQVMSMRMQPMSLVFDMSARLVRDLSRQFNKEVNLLISGAEVELDNNIIEMLKDPVVHLLRNAIDHGIEEPSLRTSLGKKKEGTIVLSAKQEGGDVLIIVEDDGKGIDKEQVKETAIQKGLLSKEEATNASDEEIYEIIMKPGFSTSKIITDTSGRGVGMDVVKTMVDRLNGSLILESTKGHGSRFILKVPATIALMNVLILRVGNMTLAVPSAGVNCAVHIIGKDISTLEGKASAFVEGQTIPLIHMSDIFMLAKEERSRDERVPIIISRSERGKIGFIVSEFLYEKEVVFQEFKGYLKRPRYFSGVATLGTGEIVLILNIQELVKARDLSGVSPITEVSKGVKPQVKRNTILVAEDSMITAELEKNILVNAGYEVDVAIDGIDAMDKLHGKKYDLLVTDIDMPRMDGFELTAKVRADKRLKDLPVIVVTVREKVEDKRKGIEVGADAYILKKEFDQNNLLNTIKRLIGE